jgi:two-component system, cell cycle sensor histidine kinase and response regulator CckA
MREVVKTRGIARQRKEDVPARYDLKFITKSGEERYGNFGAALIEYQGKPAILGSVLDITERKRMEDAIREREKTLQVFLDAVHETMIMIDTKGTVIWSNIVGAERLGIAVPELVGTCLYDYFPPNVATLRKEHYERVVTLAQTVLFEDTRLGKSFEQYCCPVFDEGGEVSGVTIFARDITARKQAERELRESEEKYRSIFESAVEGFYQTTPEGRFLSVNPALAGMMGFASPKEMVAAYTDIGKQHYVNPEDRRHFTTLLEQDGNVQAFETRLRRKDGNAIWVSLSGRAVRNAGGNVLYHEGTVEDITERKQSEEALRLSEEKFAKAFAMNPAVVAITALEDGRIIEVNETGLKTFGYTRDEVLGTSVSLSLWPTPEDRAHFAEELREKGFVHSREQTLLRRSGEHCTTLASAELLTLAGEEVILSTWIDISDRKRIEEALKESEESLRVFLNAIPHPAFLMDRAGTAIITNRALLQSLGKDDDNLAGKSILGLVDTDAGEQTYTERILETGEPVIFEDSREGRTFVNYMYPVTDNTGAVSRIAVFAFDITERKKVEQALEQEKEKYRELVENANSIILRMDPTGRITFFNEFAQHFFGYDEQEILGRNVVGTIVPQNESTGRDLEWLIEDIGRNPDLYANNVNENILHSGERVWIVWTNKPIYDNRGGVAEILCIGNDITERKNLEAQLLQAQKMEAIGTLAGGVAHDFNNILMAMMGYIGLIGTKIQDDHELRNYLSHMQDCTGRAANLTRSLLAFSRKQAIELKPQSTNMILTDFEKLLRRLVPEDVEFTLSLNEDVTIMADMTQIDQVLINLISNAKDAMTKGGALRVETKAVELGKAFKHANGFGEPGKYVMISVADTGSGMDEAIRKKIFEPFFTTKEVGRGTGLGLSIVYGIIKQHGGYITVSSKPGRGTTFDIYLPAVEAAVSEGRRASIHAEKGSETLLLAEDDPYVREIAGEILRTWGYTVVEAKDGEDAIRKYVEHSNKIDLLVLDVVMPGKNGKEAYEEIRKINPSIRALFMSGYTGDIVLDRGVKDTTVDYAQNPSQPLSSRRRSVRCWTGRDYWQAVASPRTPQREWLASNSTSTPKRNRNRPFYLEEVGKGSFKQFSGQISSPLP